MKKVLSIIISILLLATLFSCGGKEEKGNFTICINSSDESAESIAMRKGLVTGLKNMGLIEGENVTYHSASAEGNEDYAKQIVDEFSSKYKPDLFVTIGSISTKATYDNFKDKPIVFLGVANADRLGYFDENGKPTANMTGVIDSLLVEEHLDYISKNHPNVKKLGVIYNEKNDYAKYEIEYLRFNATAFDIDIKTVSIRNATDIDKALDAILPGVDAITLVHDGMVDSVAKNIVDNAKAAGKAVFGVTSAHKEVRADVSTLRDYIIVGEDGAKLVKEILVDKKNPKDVQVIVENFRVN